jgi:hypothetical protein
MFRTKIAFGLALALTACSATPKDGERMEGDVRLQPIVLSTDADPAHCAARAVLMHRAEILPDWEAAVQTPTTLHVPRNARVLEVLCVASDGRRTTARYLASVESAEARQGQAATGAMFLLFGGLPALATGAMQRTDVYEFPGTLAVALPPAEPAAQQHSAFVARRTAEIEGETEQWRTLRHRLCENDNDRGVEVMSPRCEQALAGIERRKRELLDELTALRTAQN